ncbi:DUF1351 domain-containing protein [Lactobacillus amylolyticus]|uniref:DUF1351 domain-containing protein n=1 Tax=Lactobacillus amylolyticus TaxID=83683 RepID=UPI0024901864|nr:DUF1351 domain-containing protein [Lactobacillus amylolyticus]
MNDLMLTDFSVDYEPTKISISNEEQLAESIKKYADRFKDLIVTEDTLIEAKHSRAELNKFKKALDDRRKEIKRNYTKPLKEFESKIKSYEATIDETNTNIDQGIKEFESRQRQEKLNHVKDLIDEMAPNYDVSPDETEINPSWINKSLSEKKLIEAIAGTLKDLQKQKQQKAVEEKLIQAEAKRFGLDPSGWLKLLGMYTAIEICNQIDDEAAAISAREKAKKETQEAALAAEKAESIKVDNIFISKDTGEVKVEKQIVTFKIKGTKQQLDTVAKFIQANQLEVLSSSERETVLEAK